MRPFKRIDPPPVWRENEAKWNQQWADLLEKNKNAAFSWYKLGGNTAREIALPDLRAQTQEHCSFCDGFPVVSVSADTIEHFRPKCVGRFPQHAYTWGNLYYCCSRCQLHKGEKWEDDLIAPDEAAYSFTRFFEFDFTTGGIRPSSILNAGQRLRAEVTITLYGLDTKERRRCRMLELRKWGCAALGDRKLEEYAYRDYLEPGE